jgi:hypothetical protein
MKRTISAVLSIALFAPIVALAQVQPPSGQKSLAATLSIYAFPTKGQTPSQQSEDEAACYQYAVQQTGVDPFQVQQQAQANAQQTAAAQQQAQQAGAGAGAKGAVGGAAAGALIGEIASDDPGKGAAYGAAAGLLIGHRRKKEAQEQAQAQVQQQSQAQQQATAAQMTDFKKAFSVCMQAKNYMVQY